MEEARLTEQGPVGRDGEVVSGFLGFLKTLFYHVFVCVCMMCVYPCRPEEGIGSL